MIRAFLATRRGAIVGVGLLTAALLLPFLTKPLHIDDPMYVWSADQIIHHPLDFYGFNVNWYSYLARMSDVMKNPPLAPYCLAGVILIAGRAEWAMHGVFLLWAVGAIVATYRLASRLSDRPATAALLALLTPGFLVSASTLMCDVMMLCLWLWALDCWVAGIQDRKSRPLWLAAFLATAAALTKYFAVSLLPLFLVYGVVKTRRWKVLLPLIVPVVALAGYQLFTKHLYGRGLLLDVVSYAQKFRVSSGSVTVGRFSNGLSFTGGCAITLAIYVWIIGSMRRGSKTIAIAAFLSFILVAAVLDIRGNGILAYTTRKIGSGAVDGSLIFQLAICVTAGFWIVAAVGMSAWQRRDAESLLLVLWFAGTFVFATLANWTVAARSVLPLIPAAAIAIVRLDPPWVCVSPARWRPGVYALMLGGCVAMLCCIADASLARTQRQAAEQIIATVPAGTPQVWFWGHWGFQYYMAAHGALPLNRDCIDLHPGDVMVMPLRNNSNLPRHGDLSMDWFDATGEIDLQPLPFLSTMNDDARAGFYTDLWGPLPFSFGAIEPERYLVARVRTRVEPPPGRRPDVPRMRAE